MINLTVVIDNDEAIRRLQQLQAVAKKTTSSVVTDSDRMDAALNRLKATLAQLGAGVSLTYLVRQVAQVRGEFQQLEVAFETMLGNKAKADALMAQLTKTAAITPFGLQDVAGGAKQLLAYGIASEEVNETLVRLGDIAAGLSIPLGDLVYLYGTTMTQGRLFTQDLRQFMGRGIPIAEELAKQFGVTKDQVGALVTAGKVGFPEVKKAIISLTSEGGKFGGLMEKQSKTITGLISNLEDAFDVMFNDIGQKSEGIIAGSLQAAIKLVENYQKVLDVLVPIVITYGSYRAALIGVAAAHKIQLASVKALSLGWKGLLAIVRSSTAAFLTNPVVLLTAAIAGLTYGIYKLATAETAQEKAQRKFNETMDEFKTKQAELSSQAEQLHSVMKDDATTAYQKEKAYRQLIEAYPELLDKYSKEKILLMDIVALRKEIAGITDTRDRAFAEANYKKALADYNYYNEEVEVQHYGPGARKETRKRNAFAAQKALEESKNWKKELDEIDRIQAESASTADKIAAKQAEINRLKEEQKRIDDAIADAQKRAEENAKSGRVEIYGTGSEDILQAKKQANISRQKELELEIKSLGEGEQEKPLTDEEKKRREKVAKLTAQLEADAAQARVDAMEEGNAKVLAQIRLDYDRREAEIVKQENELKALQGGKLTEEQTADFETKREASVAQKDREIAEATRQQEAQISQARIDAMKDGSDKTLKQIEFDYAQREALIKREEDALMAAQGGMLTEEQKGYFSDRRTANANQRDDAQRSVKFEEQQDLNDYLIQFGTFQEQLRAMVDNFDMQLADASNEGERMAIEAEKEAALSEIEVRASDFAEKLIGLSLSKLDEMSSRIESELENAELAYSNLESSDSDDAKALRKKIDTLRAQNKVLQSQIKAQQKAEDAKNKSKESKYEEWAKLQGVLVDVGSEFRELGGDIDGTVGDIISSAGQIATSTASMIGSIGKLADMTTEATKTTAEETSKAVQQAERASVILAIIQAAIQIIQQIYNIAGLGPDYSGYEELKAKYEALNEVWDQLLEKKEKYIKMSYGEEARNVGEEAIDIIEKQIEAYRQLGIARLNAGSGAFTSSIGKRILKNMDQEGWNQLRSASQNLGFSYDKVREGRMEGLFSLTNEQLEKLQRDAPLFWAQLDEDVRGYLESIIEGQERIGEIQTQVKEQLTQVSFENVYDSFIDTLMDMDASAEEFADQFSEYMMRAILSTQIGDAYKERLEAWYNQFAASNNDSDITSDEIDRLRSEWDAMVQEALALRDGIAEITGYGQTLEQQQATVGGFQAMDQETGSELNGRFTDIQGKFSEQLGLSREAIEGIAFISGLSLQQLHVQQDTRDILIQMAGNVAEIRTFAETLPQISLAVDKTNRILDERL